MRLRIIDGTPPGDGASLCYSCRHATVVKGSNLKEEIIQCGELCSGSDHDNRIRFKVTSCNGYKNANMPSLRSMEEIAWVLRTDPKKKKIGFVPSKDLKSNERFEISNNEE